MAFCAESAVKLQQTNISELIPVCKTKGFFFSEHGVAKIATVLNLLT